MDDQKAPEVTNLIEEVVPEEWVDEGIEIEDARGGFRNLKEGSPNF